MMIYLQLESKSNYDINNKIDDVHKINERGKSNNLYYIIELLKIRIKARLFNMIIIQWCLVCTKAHRNSYTK